MVRQHGWLNVHEFEQTWGDSGGQRSLVCCRPWGCKELDLSEWAHTIYIHLWKNILFFYLLLMAVAVCGLSLVAEGGATLHLQCVGFSLQWHLPRTQTLGRRASRTRDRTCVPCSGRQIHNRWTIREVSWDILIFWTCPQTSQNCIHCCSLNDKLFIAEELRALKSHFFPWVGVCNIRT